ncbi:MAG: CoA transferase [Pseudomonadota bacterium]
MDLAGQMARQLGARVHVDEHFATGPGFASRGKVPITGGLTPWLEANSDCFVLMGGAREAQQAMPDQRATVLLSADPLASEATLFAESGLADLLGDPDRAPLIPRGDYGAGTVAYAVLAALCGLVALRRRQGGTAVARVDAVGVLSWVNWKAAAAGDLGKDLHREGSNAEWPVIPCRDGYVALVYVERDWPGIVAMVGDERLADARFESFAGRQRHRSEVLKIISAWAATRSKAELNDLFLEHGIPAAPVMTPEDLLRDPLLAHRSAFLPEITDSQTETRSPRLAHRIVAASPEAFPLHQGALGLPLSGVRVLDLGIITAGAGVSALLADLGADVLKVESHSYPDPLRQWAGQKVSPLFKCNNRNKYGIALDLKDEQDRARFLALVADADVVVENFRRGVLDRLGLGYEVLKAANRAILLASISGQGADGPGSHASSFGSTLEASSGFSSCVSYADGVPFITGRNVNYPDQTVVLYAAAVIVAALSQPRRGLHLDIAQRDVAVYLLGETLEALATGSTGHPRDNGQAYRCGDGGWVAVSFAGSLPATKASLPDWFAERTSEQALAALTAQSVSATRVCSGSEMYAALKKRGSGTFAHGPDGALVKGFPFQFDEQPMRIRLKSPAVGEHTDVFCQP